MTINTDNSSSDLFASVCTLEVIHIEDTYVEGGPRQKWSTLILLTLSFQAILCTYLVIFLGKSTFRRGPNRSWVLIDQYLYGVIAVWSRKSLAILSGHFIENFAFLEKTTPWGKIFKISFRKDSSRHRSTYCVQISWNLAYRKSVKSCVIYLTKKNKISARSLDLASARISPKISQASGKQCTHNAPDFIQIGSLPVEL